MSDVLQNYLIDYKPVLQAVLMKSACSSETSWPCSHDQHGNLHAQGSDESFVSSVPNRCSNEKRSEKPYLVWELRHSDCRTHEALLAGCCCSTALGTCLLPHARCDWQAETGVHDQSSGMLPSQRTYDLPEESFLGLPGGNSAFSQSKSKV